MARSIPSTVLWRLLACASLSHCAAQAESVYMTTGKNGRMVFTNAPADPRSALRVDTWSQGMALAPGAPRVSYASLSMRPFPDGSSAPPLTERSPRSRAVRDAARGEFERIASDSAARWGVDEHLVHAVIEVESGFNASAVSSAGATGLMQLMPGTARRFGVRSALDPSDNIEGGVRYLRVLLQLFQGNVRLALAGYNAGEGAVIRNGWRVPPYSETQKYVPAVLAAWERRRLQAGATSRTAMRGQLPANGSTAQ